MTDQYDEAAQELVDRYAHSIGLAPAADDIAALLRQTAADARAEAPTLVEGCVHEWTAPVVYCNKCGGAANMAENAEMAYERGRAEQRERDARVCNEAAARLRRMGPDNGAGAWPLEDAAAAIRAQPDD